MSLIVRFVAALAIVATSPAIAEGSEGDTVYLAWLRAGDLAKKCSGQRAWEAAYCVGYVVGVADVINNGSPETRICIPKTVTQAQMTKVVVNYFARHPGESDYAAFSSVRIALRDRFPCISTMR
jgi:hypothetical protein